MGRLRRALEEHAQTVVELQDRERAQESQLFSLECDLAEKQEELLSWIKMDSFVCQACDTPNEVDARESPASCQMCGEVYVKDADRATWDAEASIGALELVVAGMEDRLAGAWRGGGTSASECRALRIKLEEQEGLVEAMRGQERRWKKDRAELERGLASRDVEAS